MVATAAISAIKSWTVWTGALVLIFPPDLGINQKRKKIRMARKPKVKLYLGFRTPDGKQSPYCPGAQARLSPALYPSWGGRSWHRFPFRVQETRSHSSIQGDGQAGRISHSTSCVELGIRLEKLLESCYIEVMKRSLQLRSLRLLSRSRLSY